MGSLVYPCCCCCYFRAAVMSALGGVDQLKSIAIEEWPVWRLHWSAFSSQREWVWQLTRFGGRKWRSGLNRISHPDWLKLSVELNCAPNQNTDFPFHYRFRKREVKHKPRLEPWWMYAVIDSLSAMWVGWAYCWTWTHLIYNMSQEHMLAYNLN